MNLVSVTWRGKVDIERLAATITTLSSISSCTSNFDLVLPESGKVEADRLFRNITIENNTLIRFLIIVRKWHTEPCARRVIYDCVMNMPVGICPSINQRVS